MGSENMVEKARKKQEMMNNPAAESITNVSEPKTTNEKKSVKEFKAKPKKQTKSKHVHLTMYPKFYDILDANRPPNPDKPDEKVSMNEFIELLLCEALEAHGVNVPEM